MRQPVSTPAARAERRAAPKPARIPSGDRPAYSPAEGPHNGSAVVFFTRSSTKLVLQSSTLGWRSNVSITKRE